jgi:hypothetical protein
LVEKWIPPTRSEIAEIGEKNRRILGVKKCCKVQVVMNPQTKGPQHSPREFVNNKLEIKTTVRRTSTSL